MSDTFVLQSIVKAVDDVLWHQYLGHKAKIDKWRLIGKPPQNTFAQGLTEKGSPIIFWTYTFVPRNLDTTQKHPLMVYVHGGLHANTSSQDYHIFEELLDQGYIVISPEYRGSSGYGEKHHKLIDYGGLETEDTFDARNWAVDHFDMVDPERVGIIGWSHGGLHALFNIFNHPDSYAAAYAGVPVCDLVARMGYKNDNYRKQFSADYHIGKTADEDPDEYRRRSPAWHAEKLQTPLLIQATTSDDNVNILEVEGLIKSLTAANKDFSYEIYDNAPGGHYFDRIDTPAARAARQKAYDFLARYLMP